MHCRPIRLYCYADEVLPCHKVGDHQSMICTSKEMLAIGLSPGET